MSYFREHAGGTKCARRSFKLCSDVNVRHGHFAGVQDGTTTRCVLWPRLGTFGISLHPNLGHPASNTVNMKKKKWRLFLKMHYNFNSFIIWLVDNLKGVLKIQTVKWSNKLFKVKFDPNYTGFVSWFKFSNVVVLLRDYTHLVVSAKRI